MPHGHLTRRRCGSIPLRTWTSGVSTAPHITVGGILHDRQSYGLTTFALDHFKHCKSRHHSLLRSSLIGLKRTLALSVVYYIEDDAPRTHQGASAFRCRPQIQGQQGCVRCPFFGEPCMRIRMILLFVLALQLSNNTLAGGASGTPKQRKA